MMRRGRRPRPGAARYGIGCAPAPPEGRPRAAPFPSRATRTAAARRPSPRFTARTAAIGGAARFSGSQGQCGRSGGRPAPPPGRGAGRSGAPPPRDASALRACGDGRGAALVPSSAGPAGRIPPHGGRSP